MNPEMPIILEENAYLFVLCVMSSKSCTDAFPSVQESFIKYLKWEWERLILCTNMECCYAKQGEILHLPFRRTSSLSIGYHLIFLFLFVYPSLMHWTTFLPGNKFWDSGQSSIFLFPACLVVILLPCVKIPFILSFIGSDCLNAFFEGCMYYKIVTP